MFFFFPIGHDRSIYGWPWVTFGLIGLCTALFLGSCAVEVAAVKGARAAQVSVVEVLRAHPGACVEWALEGLPAPIAAEFQPPICDARRPHRSAADAELDAAARGLIAQLNRIPTLRLGYRPARPRVGTLFANMFMHAGLEHLVGNMIFLFIAGSVLETTWRRVPFLLLFLLSGVAGTLTHHAANPTSLVPLVGASGGISGLLGAFLVNHAKTRVRFAYVFWLLLVPLKRGVVRVPAWACIPAWAALQLLSLALGADDGVAYGAHVGGFAVGIVGALGMRRFDLLEEDFAEYDEAQRRRIPSLAAPLAAPSSPDAAPPQLRPIEPIPIDLPPPDAAPPQWRPVEPIPIDLPPADAAPPRRGPVEPIPIDLPSPDDEWGEGPPR
jgi:membrane associated rhomboid family serine protease